MSRERLSPEREAKIARAVEDERATSGDSEYTGWAMACDALLAELQALREERDALVAEWSSRWGATIANLHAAEAERDEAQDMERAAVQLQHEQEAELDALRVGLAGLDEHQRLLRVARAADHFYDELPLTTETSAMDTTRELLDALQDVRASSSLTLVRPLTHTTIRIGRDDDPVPTKGNGMDNALKHRPGDYLGGGMLKKLKDHRLYALACAVEAMLYQIKDTKGSTLIYPSGTTKTDPPGAHIALDLRLYIGDGGPSWPGRDGAFFDVERTLREVSLELERMAVKDVTS